MALNGNQLVYGCGEGKMLPGYKPVCDLPQCALMHSGLSKVFFLCGTCGHWHPIKDHPETKNH